MIQYFFNKRQDLTPGVLYKHILSNQFSADITFVIYNSNFEIRILWSGLRRKQFYWKGDYFRQCRCDQSWVLVLPYGKHLIVILFISLKMRKYRLWRKVHGWKNVWNYLNFGFGIFGDKNRKKRLSMCGGTFQNVRWRQAGNARCQFLHWERLDHLTFSEELTHCICPCERKVRLSAQI